MSVEGKSWPEFIGKDAHEIEAQLKAQGIESTYLID
jgi:hypothetical protein